VDTRALKIQINAATAATRQQRLEATKLIVSGRKLRRGGRALGGDSPINPDVKGLALLKQGWERHRQGMRHLGVAESGRYDRRHQHLAAALLNGRTYKRCEPTIKPHTLIASVTMITPLITSCLPVKQQNDAQKLVREWLDRGDVRLRYLPDEEQFVMRSYDEVPARFPGKGVPVTPETPETASEAA